MPASVSGSLALYTLGFCFLFAAALLSYTIAKSASISPTVSSVSAVMLTPASAVPSALVYDRHFQFPDHSETMIAISPAAVVIFVEPGKIREVALCVNVSIQSKISEI